MRHTFNSRLRRAIGNWNRDFLVAWLLVVAGLAELPAAPHPGETVQLPKIPERTVSMADFGKGDGDTLDTAAFEQAISQLASQGGGKLIVPPGIWLTGPIKLRSKINLHLEAGALVKFAGDHRLYPLTVVDVRGEKHVVATSPISGQNLEDIAITGAGIFDGGGDAWRYAKKGKFTEAQWKARVNSGGVLNPKGDQWWPSQAALDGETEVANLEKRGSLQPADYATYHQYLRPKMLRLIEVKRLLIEGVTFQNPPNWTINPLLCEDVSILNVKVFNDWTAQNSDALDLESCRRAVIRGCLFDVGDDGICLKSGKDAVGRRIGVPTDDVLIEDCTVYRAHGGFTIGSEMSGGVRNVRVRNCTFIGTDVGLRFKTRRGRGGVVENIHISDVRMTDIGHEAIGFSFVYGSKGSEDEESGGDTTTVTPATVETPEFRGLRIENVVCRGALTALKLEGLPEMPLRDVRLKDVSISAKNAGTIKDATGVIFENVRLQTPPGEPLKIIRAKDSRLELAP